MSGRLLPLSITLMMLSCAKQPEVTATFGEPITLQEETRISKIFAQPESYVGQRVLVRGRVLDVCPSKGCWIELDSDAPDEKIQVKVEDDVIVFPQTLMGQSILVEGIVEELKLSAEQVLARKKHEAEEYGRAFDPEMAVKEETVYRIKGTGAGVLN